MIDVSPDNIIQITNNNYVRESASIWGNNVIWQGDDGNDSEIYLYDGISTIQLTDNDYDDQYSQIWGNNVVWQGDDGNDSEIYLYDGISTIQLTDNDYDDQYPQIWGNNVVWKSDDGNDAEKIYLYDGTSTIPLTNHKVVYDLQIWGNNVVWQANDGNLTEYGGYDENVKIYLYDGIRIIELAETNYEQATYLKTSGNNVVWADYYRSGKIYLYDGSRTTQLTDEYIWYPSADISDNRVVWLDYDHGNNSKIYLYDGSRTIQFTDDFSNFSPSISGNNVVWIADKNNGLDIYLYDGTSITQITNDDKNDLDVGIRGNKLVWWKQDDNDREIYFYDGSQTLQLTDNNYNDWPIGVWGDNVLWESYSGNNSALYLYSAGSSDQLDGIDESELLTGSGEDDTIFGYDGDDTLEGGVGADSLDGGEGSDTASYANASAGVTIDLASGVTTGEEAEGDRFISIENILGTSFDDLLVGDAQNNVLTGGDGSDTLRGGSGDDLLIGGVGADSFSGDDGIDTVSYVTSYAAVSVNLATGEISGGEAEGDVFLDTIENLEGSTFDDLLVGDRHNNVLKGNFGNDTLQGGAGNDSLYGGDGAYALVENQNDIYQIRGGADLLKGGAGDDFYQLNISPIQVRLNPESEVKTNLSIASGSQIEDSQGENTISLQTLGDNTTELVDATVSLSPPDTETIGIARKDNTTLVIDINQDGIANPQDDLSILNFFDQSGTGAGDGFIENVANLSGAEIVDFMANLNSFSPPEQLDFAIDTDKLNNSILKLQEAWIYDPDGTSDLVRIDLWLQSPYYDGWVNLSDIKEFNPWSEDDRWASFDYQLGLEYYPSATYTLWAQAYDRANNSSNSVIKSFTIPETTTINSPSDLSFQIERSSKTYIPTETLKIREGWVYHEDGADNLTSIDMWVWRDNDRQWIDVADVTSFTPSSSDNHWAAFDYEISLSGYKPGDYSLWGKAYDFNEFTSRDYSSDYSTNFTIAPNSAPEQLQFQSDRTRYRPGETVTLKEAWVYDADSVYDLAIVDFWLLKPDGSWDNLDDARQFEAWSGDSDWASFDYQFSLGGYQPGTYRVWAQAYDNSGETSNEAIATFTIVDSTTTL